MESLAFWFPWNWSAAVVKTVVISLTGLRRDCLFSSSPWRTLHHWRSHERVHRRKVGLCFHCRMWCTGQGRQMKATAALYRWYTETPRWVLTHTWTPVSTDTERWKWPLRLSRCSVRTTSTINLMRAVLRGAVCTQPPRSSYAPVVVRLASHCNYRAVT